MYRIIQRYDAQLILIIQEERLRPWHCTKIWKDEHIFIDDLVITEIGIHAETTDFFGRRWPPAYRAGVSLTGIGYLPPWIELPRWLPSNDRVTERRRL